MIRLVDLLCLDKIYFISKIINVNLNSVSLSYFNSNPKSIYCKKVLYWSYCFFRKVKYDADLMRKMNREIGLKDRLS